MVCRPRYTWIRQGVRGFDGKVGTRRYILSFAIDCVDVAGAACAGLVGEDGRLVITRQGEI